MQTENEQIEAEIKDVIDIMIELTANAERDLESIVKNANTQLERLDRYAKRLENKLFINKILELCRTGQ
ncbi:MAG: hypothetical protein WC856_02670 [Methylococcaceae bacterium]|jgi:hypothetical protein